ncbi:regulator [Streptomyces sp. AK02-01A]|uniref:ATP-binding protein n=1 Tax=Streptomyces sp. AK02-01A TaxID=3028648 RepID=UPI0029BAAB3A|nr:regulator [Streptomyces sp. AK02-01A]MDX3849524.1 regulator [Streptomyces sp. AK02-01A]MDX3849906.1 regulator [Streptomyces sp. AK02-01A]
MGNLPEETTSFVGRRAELVLLEHALEEHRLITLTGSGGVGKSRLALRAAEVAAGLTNAPRTERPDGPATERARGRHPDGVWWADLSPLYDDRLLLATVSDAVGLSDYSLRMPIEALCEWLADRRLLLVLDSCERIVPACAHLVGELLTAAPGLTVLTTSRQPLGAKGEYCLEVPPLPLEGDDEVLQLFRDRAADAAPQVSLDDPGTAAAAVQICRRLEGIPLAVELACARLDENSVEQIADLLTSRLDILTNENVWPQRHRALRTAIGWSHELCAPLERLLWARLSVFRGDIEAVDAQAVCAGGPLSAEAITTALTGLIAKSVVRQDGTRYRMLDTIREYGFMWLAELGEERLLTDRHAAHFAELARQAHDGWFGAEQVAWYQRMADTHADLCAALNHLLAVDPEAAVGMAGRVCFFWFCCGHLHEARIYLERALAADDTVGPHRTRALWALGMTVVLQGDHETAHRLGEQCSMAAWRDQDPESMLSAAYLLGITYMMMSRPQAAYTVADRALRALPGEPFDSRSRLRCRLIRIFALTATGRLDEAGEEAADLRRLCLEHEEYWTRSYADYQLALVRLLQGRPHEAEGHARSMVNAKRLLGDSFGIALGLDLMAAAFAAQGDGERAAHAYGTGQAYWRMVGHPQRGTPELAPVRAECERQARAAAGNLAYEDAFHRGLVDDGESGLARALLGHLPSES